MASVSMAIPTPVAPATRKKPTLPSTTPLPPVRSTKRGEVRAAAPGLRIDGGLKEKALAGATAAGIAAASMLIPEVAQAADGVSPSLKNFLLSIAAGGIVLSAIGGAVIAVANFDPVKRV